MSNFILSCEFCGGDGSPDPWDDNYCMYCDNRPEYGSRNAYAPAGVHVMNKDEGRVMRRLKNETGLTEEQIREVKKYRVMLSEAQKSGQKAKRTKLEKAQDNVMKSVTRKLKLAKEHPFVQKEYKEEWMRRRETGGIYNRIYQESHK